MEDVPGRQFAGEAVECDQGYAVARPAGGLW